MGLPHDFTYSVSMYCSTPWAAVIYGCDAIPVCEFSQINETVAHEAATKPEKCRSAALQAPRAQTGDRTAKDSRRLGVWDGCFGVDG